jgi:hypothetical protein
MYGHGASNVWTNRAGSTGMKIPVHCSGQSKSTSPRLTSCNIEVCEESKMILDSANRYSNNTIMLGIDKALNKGYRSVFREPGSSFSAVFRAYSLSSRIAISVCVLEEIGLGASVHRFTTYLSSGCHMPTFGELAGILKIAPSDIGTTIALSHSFQKEAIEPSLPKMP